MKWITYAKSGLCVLLAGALITLTACNAGGAKTVPAGTPSDDEPEKSVSAGGTAGSVRKSETVYVTMDAQGNPTMKLVTDWLHTDTAGVTVRDKSDLTDIQNIKGNEAPVQDGSSLIWSVAGTDLYYKGVSEKKLPVDIRIRYLLDGKETAPADLAGKSGRITIEITVTNTDAHAVTAEGKTVTMYTPVMVAGGIILPEETFRNVQVENGTVIGDGSKQIAAFVCIPGLEKSLDLSGAGIDGLDELSFPESFTVTADAADFELGNMAFAMTTDIPELEELKNDFSLDSMKQNLYDLRDMQDGLQKIDPDHLLRDLFTDPQTAAGAQTLTGDLAAFYEMDTSLLDSLPDIVTEDNIGLFERLRADVKEAKLSEVLNDPDVLALLDRMETLDREKIRSLMADVNELREIDTDRLADVIGMLGGADQLAALLKGSTALADQVSANTQAMQTMQALLGYSDDAFSLLSGVKALSAELEAQGVSLTEEDIDLLVGTLVKQKAMEKAASSLSLTLPQLNLLTSSTPAELIPDSGEMTADQRTVITVCLNMAAARPDTGEEGKAQIRALISLLSSPNAVPAAYLPALRGIVGQIQPAILTQLSQAEETVRQQSAAVSQKVKALLTEAKALGGRLDALGTEQVQNSLHFVQNLMPGLNELVAGLEQNREQIVGLESLLEDKETMAYLQQTSRKLVAMKADLDDNAENLALLEELMGTMEDPAMQAFARMLPTLRQDLNDAKPVLDALAAGLEDPQSEARLKDAPSTLATLLKMKADLEANRQIADALTLATDPENTALAAGIVSKLDRLQAEDTVGGYLSLLESADTLKARAEAYLKLSDDYRLFTDAAEGMDTDVKFIMKTDAIRKPEAEETAADTKEAPAGLIGWIKNLFKKDET